MNNLNIDRSERVLYDMADYPVYVRKGALSSYPNYSAESHWHNDVEFILILSGEMLYNVNGEIVLLREGEGIFVNSGQLHFGYSDKREECVFICVILHPVLLCSSKSMEENCIKPIISDESIPYYRFGQTREWERGVLSAIREIYNVCGEKFAELKIQRAFFDIWISLCENIISAKKETVATDHHLSTLKDMLSYINQNYREKLTLENIAHAGGVGKTGCCAIFKKYINKTPNGYLTELRLRHGTELLLESDKTVLEISYEVGFSGASYFTEMFRRFYGCSPREYRKNGKR